MEAKMALACILKRFKFERSADTQVSVLYILKNLLPLMRNTNVPKKFSLQNVDCGSNNQSLKCERTCSAKDVQQVFRSSPPNYCSKSPSPHIRVKLCFSV